MPRRTLVTRSARQWALAERIANSAARLGSDVIELKSDRLPAAPRDQRAGYAWAKTTLAVVAAPPSARRLQPIPPSADWQFHIARGCPAHCQYCYLAGSLSGPPLTRVYANLPEILEGLREYEGKGTVTSASTSRAHEGTTFEVSCYTDPLALEHLTGSLSECVRYFGSWNGDVQLRCTTKFDDVEGLTAVPHNGRTRLRFSVNAPVVARMWEGGTATLHARLAALRRVALAGFPVGLTIAPIMNVPGWREGYGQLLAGAAEALRGVPGPDLTIELITHRFTPQSREVLLGWYPGTTLELDPAQRTQKRTKFGSTKYVYPAAVMRELRTWFEEATSTQLPFARLLYWT
ncbi:MAG TPA: hypothetical protein VES20_21900 [Bryobacteraceae bacterium]|nr:hypothetical protein [Bryobacteraceae bacterium]